jgi:REP element-mobilizing transposase RayT
MARIARVVVPGLPHHLTQRGNRREPVFGYERSCKPVNCHRNPRVTRP